MAEQKLVSVCINAYNSEKYIAETLKSVCNQTYQNLQIIVVDDASTDSTAEIVKSIDDPRIELYSLERNGHISNANNETYRKIRGEYMVHIDSDDLMYSDLIEKSVKYLEENPEYGASFCRLEVIDENGNSAISKFKHIQDMFKVSAKTQAEFIRLFFDSSNHLSHCGATIRKSVIDDIGFHDLSLCYLHDFDYWTRLILKYPIHVFDEILIKYRMDTTGDHNSSMDEQKTIAHNTEYSRIIYNMIDNCPDELFLEAFSDKLLLSGPHTHQEIELEKAFLLQQGLAVILPENKILGITKLARLFQDDEYVRLAQDKFNYSIRDFYKTQAQEVFHDKAKIEAQHQAYEHQKANLEKRVHNISCELSDTLQDLEQTRAELLQCNMQLGQQKSILEQTQAELSYHKELVAYKQRLLDKTVEYQVAKRFKKIYGFFAKGKK